MFICIHTSHATVVLFVMISVCLQVNALDGYGRAALHYAAEKEVACVEYLLHHGAEVDIRDSNMDTALHWATFKNKSRCVRYLLENGSEVNALNYNEDTPLIWACLRGNLEAMKILLEYNATVDIVNLCGQTPLMRVVFFHASGLNSDKNDACLELLLKAVGQFDMRGEDGQLMEPFYSDNKLSEMLLPYCSSPRTLKQLCRYTIRSNLGPVFLPDVVCRLPIPYTFQEYLLLQRER